MTKLGEGSIYLRTKLKRDSSSIWLHQKKLFQKNVV